MAVVTLYTRPECPLCDEAVRLLHRLAPKLGFELQEVNIEEDEELLRRYALEIPVVAVNGRPLLAAPIEGATLRRTLERALER